MKKEIVAIILLLVVASIVFASGLKSEANVSAEWNNSTAEFDVELNNAGAPADEVRLYISGLDDVECQEIDGWSVLQFSGFPDKDLGSTDMCWYFTDGSLEGRENFLFTADTPEELTPVEMRFELREDAQESGEINSYLYTYNWGVE